MRTKAGNRRSMVLAPTVTIQGASLATEPGAGPLFPAAQITTTPFSMARKAPMAMLERESTSTPSLMASSIPARMSEL
ncbi:unnamed protein product [Spirodela intermedia]|uniref:Uncharacterized protein n=1 Tax=Spirodela intermedia TaxID=51605 RepID=A0A7I8ICJ3_SPIIN|nr:unnamed protein product [Spirodela intermedia]CAA6655369.1 unnamed protein product [Spirodela intermedia]